MECQFQVNEDLLLDTWTERTLMHVIIVVQITGVLLPIQQTANGDDDYNVKASAMTSGPDISDISPKPRSSMLTTGTSYIQ